jgi:peptidoglycan/LPS O-acetylase OafA/YrhL
VEPTSKQSKHLHELDLVRLLTFACVIAVHTTFYVIGDGRIIDGAQTLLHCTRGVFFALTAFVLVRSMLAKPRRAREFWPRRFLLVGVPYLTWSFVYVVVPWAADPSTRGNPVLLVGDYVGDTVMGIAEYHLYFLLVTMQVYLVVPAIVWAVRRFRDHHGLLLLGALVVQVTIVAISHDLPSWVAWTQGGLQQVFPTYLFFIMVGAVAAAHAETVLAWVRAHGRTIVFGVAGVAVVALVTYAAQLVDGMPSKTAGEELQPVEVLWSVAAGVGLLALGARWADRRRADSVPSRVVAWASDRSFGIFLAHPLVLSALLAGGWFTGVVPEWAQLPIAYVVVLGGAIGITEVARRSPLSLALTGRRTVVRRGRVVAPVAPVGAAPVGPVRVGAAAVGPVPDAVAASTTVGS